MEESYSIARARDELARLVHRVEKRKPVVLTRRGIPVAVLISYHEFTRLNGESGFADAMHRFREEHADELDETLEAFDNLRDDDPGREVDL